MAYTKEFPIGIHILPPGASYSISSSGTFGRAPPTWIMSYGACSGIPFLPSAVIGIICFYFRRILFYLEMFLIAKSIIS